MRRWERLWAGAVGLAACAAISACEADGARLGPTADAGASLGGDDAPGAPPADAGASHRDAGAAGRDAGAVDAGDDAPDADGGEEGFGTAAAPPPACTSQSVDAWSPARGPSGGLIGHGVCGSSAPSCPTDYAEGNVGEPCQAAGDCRGLDPLCLWGSCSSRGCELGSNHGCPEGDTCIDGGADTYCVEGCGIDVSGCFVGCGRDGFACFNTESKTMGYCLDGARVAECDSSVERHCDPSTTRFGEALCIQIAWDDPSVGKCFETCDPIAQDCQTPNSGCYAVRDYPEPVCFENWGLPEGSSCTRLTHCDTGLKCECDFDDKAQCPSNTNMHCRLYCATDGSTPCPAGDRCRPIAGWPGLGACVP